MSSSNNNKIVNQNDDKSEQTQDVSHPDNRRPPLTQFLLMIGFNMLPLTALIIIIPTQPSYMHDVHADKTFCGINIAAMPLMMSIIMFPQSWFFKRTKMHYGYEFFFEFFLMFETMFQHILFQVQFQHTYL